MNKLSAFIPLKEHSQRLPNKNFRILNGKPLYRWVLDTLINNQSIDQIIIDTDSTRLIQNLKRNKDQKIKVFQRKQKLCGDDISMNLIIHDNLPRIKSEHILQTHVTNPLITSETITSAINTYFDNLKQKSSDSLFSVTQWQKRFFYKGKPVNHNLSQLVQTQDLEPVYEENSNFYIFSKTSFLVNYNRLGVVPEMFSMNPREAIDIDYPYEFLTAAALMKDPKKL